MKKTRVRYKVGKALSAAFVACTFFAASALQAEDTNAPTAMKPTVVTGSYIPVSAGATVASPVDIVTAQKIDLAGASDVLNTLRKVDVAFAGNANLGQEINNNSFGGGEANVAIRNLPTVVLLDGRRLANSALSLGAAVDLNQLPLIMIDRVEVLKDGASSIYGSDAIGGVVNIITKKNFNGVEISGRYGITAGQPGRTTEQRASIIGGASDDNTSIVVGGDWYHMDPVLSMDRYVASATIPELLNEVDANGNKGIRPPSYYSGSFPGRVGNYVLAGSPLAVGAPGYNAAIVSPPIGQVHTFAELIALGYYVPINQTALGRASGTSTILNTTQFGTVSMQEQDRRTAFANAEHKIFEDKVRLYGQFEFADNKYNAALAPSPIGGLGLAAGGNMISVPPSIYNPFGTTVGEGATDDTLPNVRTRTVEFGNRSWENNTEFYHFVGGLRGDITENYSYDVGYNYNLSQQQLIEHNAVNGFSLNQALTPMAPGSSLSMLQDFAGNNLPLYNIFALPGFNDPRTIDAMRATIFQRGSSELWDLQGHVNGSLFDLPAGRFALAVGGGYLAEKLTLSSDGLLQTGNALGYNPNGNFPGGTRNRTYAFAEANIPVLGKDQDIPGIHKFDITASGRFEHLEPGGDSTVPKVGILWEPIDEQFKIRASYSEGFIAPTLYTLFGPTTPNYPSVTIINPVLGNFSGQVPTFEQSNSGLKPAESVNYNAGFVLQPKAIKGLTLTLDYYNITETGIGIIPDYNQVFADLNARGSASPYASGVTFQNGSRLTSTAPNQVTYDSGDPAHDLGTLTVQRQPGAGQRTDGIDLSMTYMYDTENYGKFTLYGAANVLLGFDSKVNESAPWYPYKGYYTPNSIGMAQGTLPDWFVTDSLTWDYKGISLTVGSRFIPEVSDPGTLFPTAGGTRNNRTPGGNAWQIDSWYAIDLQLAYKFGDQYNRWLRDLRLAVGVNNLTDNTAPFISSGGEDNTDKQTYDILGRFVYFEVSKKF